MPISLLFSDRSLLRGNPLDRKLLYQLSIDRSLSYFCADIRKQEKFLSVLSEYSGNKADVEYRQSILRDFLNNTGLHEQISSIFRQFEELKTMHKTSGGDGFRISVNRSASVSSSRNILQTRALSLERTLLLVQRLCELLSNYPLKSSGLRRLYAECRDIYEKPEFKEMLAFCGKYVDFSTHGFLDFKFEMNEEGHIRDYQLIDHDYIHITDPDVKTKGLALFKKTSEKQYPCARLYPGKNDFYTSLTISALSDLSKLFASVSKQIFEKFSPMNSELDFYSVALQYIAAMGEKEISYCFPKISDDSAVEIRGLYDLYLLMSSENPKTIVPNDLRVPVGTRGILLFGDTGSGKTAFLRAIGCLQLFSQAGLPVPAESVTIPFCSQIAAQFSEGEKEFCAGNDAGRFEQEVRELAFMVDNLREGALVFLNETFQSTAYSEGADGLCSILKYFSDSGIRWILVSNIDALESILKEDALILHTAQGYKIF